MNCCNCGAELEEGFVSFHTTDGLDLYWDKKAKRWWQNSDEAWRLTGWVGDGQRPAYRCKDCGLITFSYKKS